MIKLAPTEIKQSEAFGPSENGKVWPRQLMMVWDTVLPTFICQTRKHEGIIKNHGLAPVWFQLLDHEECIK